MNRGHLMFLGIHRILSCAEFLSRFGYGLNAKVILTKLKTAISYKIQKSIQAGCCGHIQNRKKYLTLKH